MNLNKEDIQKAIKSINEPESDSESIRHETTMIMYRFLSEVERLAEDNDLTRKQLAEKIGTSASYITQLFRGNKIVNLETIAKFQKALNVRFDIKATPMHEETVYSKSEPITFKVIPGKLFDLNKSKIAS